MVLLSAHGMDVAAIAKVAFTSEDRVRDVLYQLSSAVTWAAETVVAGAFGRWCHGR